MRIVRDDIGVTRPEMRSGLGEEVSAIIEAVRLGGEHAVREFTERFDHAELAPDELRVDPRELEAAIGVLEPDVLDGLRTAIRNVRAVARAQLGDPISVELEQGQVVEVVERIASCTARLIANPVAHKLKAEQIDDITGRIRP